MHNQFFDELIHSPRATGRLLRESFACIAFHKSGRPRGWLRQLPLANWREIRSPHPLFDQAWYLENNPDVAAAGFDPLWHYMRFGRSEGRKPNLFFDPAWYLGRYPDVAAAGVDPIQHFMHRGAAEGRDPSPVFQTRWYVQQYKDVAASGMNPLAHYLRFGKTEGREANGYRADFSYSKPVTATAIECRKKPPLRREVALLVTHSSSGTLKPHVRHYLQSLAREGIGITLIVAADRGFTDDEPWLYDLVDGLYVRVNEGFDFACWAHVLLLNSHLYRADILYWLNDSLVGPVNQRAFHALLGRLRDNPAALVGLTANEERGWHLQSYFLAIKRQALESRAFHEFMLDVKCLPTKEDVINAYEIRFSPKLGAANVSAAALFESTPGRNPTIHDWRRLLENGFAFLKVIAVTNDIPDAEKSGWREALQQHGYDVNLADLLLAELEITPTRAASPAGTLTPSASFRQHDLHWVQPSVRSDFNALRAIKPRGRIAVVVHIYYEDLWTEISAALDNIDEPFDLFVTLVAGKSNDLACALKQSWPFAHVLVVENHGRDILPFLSIARTEILFRYEFVCKLHTKRSLWREDGERWRQELIKGVLGNRHAVQCILRAFRADPDLGLVVADGQMFSGRELWAGNEMHLTRLFRQFGMDEQEFNKSFAGGSIFWIRSCLLGPICDLAISFDDFELEPLGSDGGLAHAIERLISLICYEAGMVIKETSGILAACPARREVPDLRGNATPRGAETDEKLGGRGFDTQAEQYEQQLREQSTQVLALQKARMETTLRAALAAREHEQVRAALAAAERGKASSEEEVMRLRAENAEFVGSIAWRATQRLVCLRKAPRAVERTLRRALKSVWRTVTLKLPSQLLKRPSSAPTTTQVVAEPVSALTVTEATRRRFVDLEPLRTRPDPRSGRRISIITDSVNPGLLYGGVGTAIALAALLARRAGADLRLVTRHQMADPGHLRPVLDAFGISWEGDIDCVFAPHGGGTVVPMFDGDILLTTSWWTTQAAMRTVDPRAIIYLLQEDERMFYPHGDERLRCAETIGSGDIRFVVNSELLFEHFIHGSEALPNIARRGIWFEPAFPMAHYYDDKTARQQRSKSVRNFLFYARPNNLRNLYWRGLEAISASIQDGILTPDDWNIIFVGRDLEPITLPRGVRPTILQNLPWHDYGALIRQIDVGLALIDTPHPSYPPLDLAASGAVAVTNRSGSKTTLTRYSGNILCVNPTIIELKSAIADAIAIASNSDLRAANYTRSMIARDWNDSFEPVLRRCLEWVCEVPSHG